MKVILVASANPSRPSASGIQSYVVALARVLARRGAEVVLLGLGSEPSSIDGFEFVPILDRIAVAPQFSMGIARFVRRHRNLDGVVHAQRPDDLLGFHIGAPHLPTIVTLHGAHAVHVSARRGKVVGDIYGAVERYSLERTRAALCVSRDTLSYFESRYPDLRDRLHLIPAGVDMNSFQPKDQGEARKRFGIPETARVALFVGRFEPEKNPIEILESFHAVSLVRPEAQLILIGNGSLGTLLRLRAGQVGPSVRIVESVPQSELAWLYSAANVLVLASRHEGLPTVALEALASGTPVVGPAVGILPEVIVPGINGYVVPRVSQLSEFMEKALCETRWVSEHCRESVRHFGWDDIAPAILEVYHEVSS
jgi:glycosyltransferase involved in cell wall biosynthesis